MRLTMYCKCFLILLLLFPISPGHGAGNGDAEELGQKIGQMLMIGFRGLEVDQESPIVRDIENGLVGGVVIFDYDLALDSPVRNVKSPEQLQKLIADLQAVRPETLLVAVDQEGGKVARLKEKYGFPPTVSQQWLGKTDDPELTYEYAARTVATLQDMGINVNLAPVVDVNVNPDNPVIGKLERSFSSDPEKVAVHAAEVIKAHRDRDILTALKHFPGHGSSSRDSHHGFTDVTATWSEMELLPYELLFDAPGVDMVMTAHVFNSRLDPKWPATLSPAVLTALLREKLGYDGVIISDDMQMGAIHDEYGLQTALEQTIKAGADIIIFGNNLVYDQDIALKAREIILDLIQEGQISRDRIDGSYKRIQQLKSWLQ